MSKVYSLKYIQRLPVTIERAWNYFSRPGNLVEITPTSLGFTIRSEDDGQRMYAGQLIEYTVRPVCGIPLYWMTEITHVEHLRFFVDEQRFGPYSFWHHQHHFKSIGNEVEMTDIIHYKVPFWFLGDLANSLLIRKKLSEIFEYRRQIVEQMFGKVS